VKNMAYNYLTKGSTVKIGVGATDIKALIVEDFDLGVGDEPVTKETASDGTVYLYSEVQGDNTVDLAVTLTEGEFDAIHNAVYGAGSTVVGGTQWSLRNAGGTINDIVIVTPTVTGGTTKLTYTAVNSKGVSIVPQFRINKGWKSTLKFACDYWTVKKTT